MSLKKSLLFIFFVTFFSESLWASCGFFGTCTPPVTTEEESYQKEFVPTPRKRTYKRKKSYRPSRVSDEPKQSLRPIVSYQGGFSVKGSVPFSGCNGLKKEVWQKFTKCSEQTPGTQVSCPYISIQDAETKKFFVVDRRSNSCVVNTYSAIGLNTGRPGRRNRSEMATMMPAGIFVTKKHNGKRYQSHNSIGLRGLSAENDRALGRGVVMHRYRGRSTHGCNGIQGFPRVHRLMKNQGRYRCLHFNYFAKGQCGSRNYTHRSPSYGRRVSRRPSRRAKWRKQSTRKQSRRRSRSR